MVTTPDILPIVAPADHVPGPPQGSWTYAAIPEDGRYEVVDGVLYRTLCPNERHQSAAGNFTAHLKIHVQFTGLGRVYRAPFNVELGLRDVVQPDVVVILNANRDVITPSRVIGAPDLVIEILSPSTAGHDRRKKQDTYARVRESDLLHQPRLRRPYARARVREYWIADPASHTVEVLHLDGDEYRSLGVFRGRATLVSGVVPDLPVPVEDFFA